MEAKQTYVMENLTAKDIKSLTPEKFKERLAGLNSEFSRLNKELLVPLALEIKKMRENCRHVNSEQLPYVRICHDCGEYYKIDTSFSPETEKLFAEQSR